MEEDLELEMMLFENEENLDLYQDSDPVEPTANLTDRWAHWVNVVNR